jgi:hypothetical protein
MCAWRASPATSTDVCNLLRADRDDDAARDCVERDREELRLPEGATEEEATYAVVHRDCFKKVMHPSYRL